MAGRIFLDESVTMITTSINLYIDHLRDTGRRERTIKERYRALIAWANWASGRPVSLESLHEFHDYLAKKRKWKPRYKNLIMAQVKALLNWMRKRGHHDLTSTQISDALESFPYDREPPVVLTVPQIRAIAQACKDSDDPTGRMILAVMLTGTRYNEILSLKPTDITEQGVTVTGENSKNRNGRTIPAHILGDRVMALMQGAAFSWRRSVWNAIQEQSGVKVPIKALRSTWGTYAVSRGILNPWQAAKVCGHTLAVAEQNYYGAPIFGLTGDTVDEWLGISDMLRGE